ncbi:expressed protein [Phakopsora pachyrhizi]|uniref:Expressed protein n=1 Tax=Phakopsora pachyrhizi TaxID=170000 RepID=A0AAV0BLB1_PHAPC|nr:expressed protein [Phakopsora pachyrhizi]
MDRNQKYVAGILTSATLESDGVVRLLIQENKLEDTSFESPSGQRSWIKLSGDWVKYIQPDLESTVRAKFYLDHYEPHWDEVLWRWEYKSGVRVDLTMVDDDDRMVMKRIDISASTSQLLSNPIKLSPCSDSARRPRTSNVLNPNSPPPTEPLKRPRQSSDPSSPHSIINSPEQSSSLTIPNSEKKARTKTLNENLNSNDQEQRSIDAFPKKTSSSPIASCSSSRIGLCEIELANDPSDRTTLLSRKFSNPVRHDSMRSTVQGTSSEIGKLNNARENSSIRWKTLKEIEVMEGGPQRCFDFVGIITQTKTSTCEKAGLGTCDYKMTLYLTDNSRSVEDRDVTCNLFWKNERSCPPWLEAQWKVIFLWSVHKRRSDHFNTQLVGPSGGFRWALWCPGHHGSEDTIELGPWDPYETLKSLKNRAQILYQNHLSKDILNDGIEPSLPVCTSNQPISRIYELKHKPLGTIVDLWHAAPDSDRLTVTDFTKNPLPIKKYSPTQSVSRLHYDNGGNPHNWSITTNRLFSIYVSQPILLSVLKKIESSQAENGDDEGLFNFNNNEFSNAHRLRVAFSGKYFKLSQVSLKRRADGSLYGSMERNPSGDTSKYINHHQDGNKELQYWSRVVCLEESDPIVRKCREAFEVYRNELKSIN